MIFSTLVRARISAGPGRYGRRFQLGRAGPLLPEIWLGRICNPGRKWVIKMRIPNFYCVPKIVEDRLP